MGIMDVLEALNGPEYDEPAPLEEAAAPEGAQEPEPVIEAQIAAETPRIIDVEAVPVETEVPAMATEEPETTEPPRRRKGIRPELIMGIVAALAAVLLIAVVVLCQPYFEEEQETAQVQQSELQKEDPFLVTERPRDEFLEPTVPETEPENPTIPPDTNPHDQYDFQYNRHNYLLHQNLTSYPGVDVSAYQGDIDWKKVKASGIDFAIIRLGYRGYESGKLVEDAYAVKNLDGAREAGLRVGAYFFSQALTINEVDQEIDFMLEILGDRELDMHVVLDWEIPASTARTAKMDARTLTDIQRHFCGQMRDRGYKPMIYFNWHQSENLYYLSDLEEYEFWLALYQDRMTYPWKVEMWQYSSSGKVPGINGPVDLNVYIPD